MENTYLNGYLSTCCMSSEDGSKWFFVWKPHQAYAILLKLRPRGRNLFMEETEYLLAGLQHGGTYCIGEGYNQCITRNAMLYSLQ
jgi:hypothetical protein